MPFFSFCVVSEQRAVSRSGIESGGCGFRRQRKRGAPPRPQPGAATTPAARDELRGQRAILTAAMSLEEALAHLVNDLELDDELEPETRLASDGGVVWCGSSES